MRRAAGPFLLVLTFLFGCHRETAPTVPVATSITQVADNLLKVIPEQDPRKRTTYDLTKTEDQASLKEALKPYGPAFAQAEALLGLGDPTGPFMPVSEIIQSSGPSAKRLATLKKLEIALCDRAQLEYTQGETVKGLKDISMASHLCHQIEANPGAMLPAIVEIACANVFLRAVQAIAAQDALSAKELRQLAALVRGLDTVPDYGPIIRNEVTADEKSKDHEQLDTFKRVESFTDSHPGDSLGAYNWLSRTYGPVYLSTDATAIAKMPVGRQVELQLQLVLRLQGQVRITLAYLEALAEKSEKGKFPTALPTTGKEAKDPFGGGDLSYHATDTGFTVAVPHAPEAKGETVSSYSLAYPLQKPPKAFL